MSVREGRGTVSRAEWARCLVQVQPHLPCAARIPGRAPQLERRTHETNARPRWSRVDQHGRNSMNLMWTPLSNPLNILMCHEMPALINSPYRARRSACRLVLKQLAVGLVLLACLSTGAVGLETRVARPDQRPDPHISSPTKLQSRN